MNGESIIKNIVHYGAIMQTRMLNPFFITLCNRKHKEKILYKHFIKSETNKVRIRSEMQTKSSATVFEYDSKPNFKTWFT